MHMTGLYDGKDPSVSHGKGKLPDPPQASDSPAVTNNSPGRGSGETELGIGKSFTSGKINHIPPGKGPGTAMGLTAGKAKGLESPMGQTATKP